MLISLTTDSLYPVNSLRICGRTLVCRRDFRVPSIFFNRDWSSTPHTLSNHSYTCLRLLSTQLASIHSGFFTAHSIPSFSTPLMPVNQQEEKPLQTYSLQAFTRGLIKSKLLCPLRVHLSLGMVYGLRRLRCFTPSYPLTCYLFPSSVGGFDTRASPTRVRGRSVTPTFQSYFQLFHCLFKF